MSIELFGKYILFKQLGVGGMAEVHLATDEDEILYAVKRILPSQANNIEFARMFDDELNLAERLDHPNIVNVLDHGEIEQRKYIAMEYIHGRDLRSVLGRGIKQDFFLPIYLAVYIIAETLEGLHYAHSATDDQGRPLNLVHRDVNPFNMLVAFDGSAKLFDFGIAKADGSVVQQARQGQLKGKFGYLSPEQCSGQAVDHRSDIFSCGTVLYEITVGTRLFKESTDIKTLNAITEAKVPLPQDRNPQYPDDLQDIVMKALAREQDDRYEDAGKFAQALREWLAKHFPDTGQQSLARYLAQIFTEEERQAPEPPSDLTRGIDFDDLGRSEDDQGGQQMSENQNDGTQKPEEGQTETKSGDEGSEQPTPEKKPQSESERMFGPDPELFEADQKLTEEESGLIDFSDFSKGRTKGLIWLGIFLLVGAGVAIYIWKSGSTIDHHKSNRGKISTKHIKKAEVPTQTVVLTTKPEGAEIWIDFSRQTKPTPVTATLPVGNHTFWVYKKGFLPVLASAMVRKGSGNLVVATLKKPGDDVTKGGLTVVPDPRVPGTKVFLGDKSVGDENLVVRDLAVGHPYLITIKASDKMDHVMLVWPSTTIEEKFPVKMYPFNDSPAQFPVRVITVPSGARLLISDGKGQRFFETDALIPGFLVGATYDLSLNYRNFPAIKAKMTMKLPFTLVKRFVKPKKGNGKITVKCSHPTLVYVEKANGHKDTLGTTPEIVDKELEAGTHKLLFMVIIDAEKGERVAIPGKFPVTIEAGKTLVKTFHYADKKLKEVAAKDFKLATQKKPEAPGKDKKKKKKKRKKR